MRISVELVPRSEAEVYADASLVHAAMPEVNAFNIPDLMHFPLRSWDACAIASKILPASIPHIRAIDIPPLGDLPMAEAILAAGLSEVLVIRGDPPRDLSHQTYPNTSDDIIRRFKRHHPKLKVFAAFDPYRQSFRDELDAVARKMDAGADGFFTQPIFDLRLLEVCAEMLRGHNVFWVIARLWDRVHELTGRRRTKSYSPPISIQRSIGTGLLPDLRSGRLETSMPTYI